MLLKLYKKQDDVLHYWETWSKTPTRGIIHWGIVGERGLSTKVSATSKTKFQHLIQEAVAQKRAEGFAEAALESILVVEYEAKIMTSARLKKLHRLEERLDQLLGWTGLGHTDGNGFGFEKMDVSAVVVDFETAKKIIEADLEDTEFAKYLSISQVRMDEDESSNESSITSTHHFQ
jgi:hypothetical protein